MTTPDRVWEALQRVTDPEYPLSIVDLGMIYAVEVHESRVDIAVTFTSIGCPAIEMIVADIEEEVEKIPGVSDVEVEVVWDPPWTKNFISPKGRKVLRMYGVVAEA